MPDISIQIHGIFKEFCERYGQMMDVIAWSATIGIPLLLLILLLILVAVLVCVVARAIISCQKLKWHRSCPAAVSAAKQKETGNKNRATQTHDAHEEEDEL